MGLPTTKTRITVEEYLARERAAEERSIYLDGEVFAMAEESDAHGIISVNVVVSLGTQLRGSPCSLRTKDTKIRSGLISTIGKGMAGMFSYPDVLVVCGEPEYHDARRDIILKPKAILEILSESTEAFDRGKKFERYQTYNRSLTDYLLVSQDEPHIEHFSRQPDGSWSYRLYKGLDCVVPIPSIGCTLNLAEVYDGVRFPTPEEP